MSDGASYEQWCSLCAVGRGEGRLAPTDGTVVGHVGDDVMVLVRPTLDEVLVAPAAHVANLGELREPSLGELLGALRRVTLLLRAGNGTVSLTPTNDVAGAAGHLCIRVVHGTPGSTARRAGDAKALARRLQG
jgi:hypothetical protein